ncbi:unnamed protein product [Lepeophtheirus salmonis]|uniref:(salmon louse) hypothetical protein n=1 Tax=Lepeophtheirus salmonis TaxID=72036 RepID=A0A7R8D6L0_LEPSM|nr:unnamed protein product [Lepeophtheirus salmonis]CAF3045357.1 unnamed protein product [Lepeophtheirus salmonis]
MLVGTSKPKDNELCRGATYQRSPVVHIPDIVPITIWRDSGDFISIVESDKTFIPPIKKAHIDQYIIQRQVGDDIQNLDIAPMRKVRQKSLKSHCECVAGIGPHGTCKHVVSALLIMENFVSNDDVYLSKSSKETLQTFKSPRKLYGGEPVVPEKLCRALF